MDITIKNFFKEDDFILELNKNKNIIPLPHPCKWNSTHMYYNLFEIKQEVLESRNQSKCKFKLCNKIESKDDFKKLINHLAFLNKNADEALFNLYIKYEKMLPK
jgi:hypothetical protein